MSKTTFWQRHSICSALRTVATARGRQEWERRISEAAATELVLIGQELRALAGYDGKVIFRPELVQKGREEAEALREIACERLVREGIEPFFAQLKFPYLSILSGPEERENFLADYEYFCFRNKCWFK